MPKPIAQRVKETAERHRARGERQIKLWLPDDDDVIQQFRDAATKACKDAQTVN